MRRKIYGAEKIDVCPFCTKRAVTKSTQGIPTCQDHKAQKLLDVKCICGQYLDLLEGKWGPYFRCEHCGNISFKKGLEFVKDIKVAKDTKVVSENEITITSDDLEYM